MPKYYAKLLQIPASQMNNSTRNINHNHWVRVAKLNPNSAQSLIFLLLLINLNYFHESDRDGWIHPWENASRASINVLAELSLKCVSRCMSTSFVDLLVLVQCVHVFCTFYSLRAGGDTSVFIFYKLKQPIPESPCHHRTLLVFLVRRKRNIYLSECQETCW